MLPTPFSFNCSDNNVALIFYQAPESLETWFIIVLKKLFGNTMLKFNIYIELQLPQNCESIVVIFQMKVNA